MRRAGQTELAMGRELFNAPIGPGGKSLGECTFEDLEEMIKGLNGR